MYVFIEIGFNYQALIFSANRILSFSTSFGGRKSRSENEKAIRLSVPYISKWIFFLSIGILMGEENTEIFRLYVLM